MKVMLRRRLANQSQLLAAHFFAMGFHSHWHGRLAAEAAPPITKPTLRGLPRAIRRDYQGSADIADICALLIDRASGKSSATGRSDANSLREWRRAHIISNLAASRPLHAALSRSILDPLLRIMVGSGQYPARS